ncbi:MAG: DUF1592 domain-containing protein [Myxococcota bacterium]
MRGLRWIPLAFALTGSLACGHAPSGGDASGGSNAAGGLGNVGGTSGGALGAGGSAAGSLGFGGAPPAECANAAPPTSPLALLTRTQFDNTVLDLLGDRSNPAAAFPPENQVDGFKNNTFANQASPLLVEKYLAAAESLASNARARMSELAPCAAGGSEAECGRNFVRNFGAKAFRRPLDDAETRAFDALFESVLMRSGYASAFELTLQAFLQSPQFLYRTDSLASPDVESGAVPLGPYELAARLSYFLTGSMPDAELTKAAAENRLTTDAEVEQQARRLLGTPRARAVVREFHHQWLALDALPAVTRDVPASFTSDAAWLGKDWVDSFDRFVDHVYWDSGKVSELFGSKRVYVNARLARLYGVAPPSVDFTAVELEDRAGIITQPALLALLAHSNQSAPVLRGVFALERLMCTPVPPPPPSVNAIPPDPDPKATTRERFFVHTQDSACSGCHSLIDGVGFGFEAYDQLGRYRTEENQKPIDTSGNVLLSDAELAGSFRGAKELAGRLAASSRVRDCVATGWYRFAFGRVESDADRCSLDDVKRRFAESRGDFRELLVAITRSLAFRYRPAIAKGGL